MQNFIQRVNVYDNNLDLMFYASFTTRQKAEDYARKLRSTFSDRVGKVELEVVYYE